MSEPLKRRRGRPPKIERSFDDTKQAIIRAGLELITEFGFQSAGIEPLLKKINVPKGSFYHYFSSKDDFGLAVLKAYGSYFSHKLSKHLENTTISPIERMDAFVADAERGLQKYEYKRGCLVGNLMQEVPQLSETLNIQLVRILEQWQSQVKACLDEGKLAGQVAQDCDTAYLAKVFWSSWEGAVMQVKVHKSTQPLDEFWQFFKRSL